MSNNNNTLIRFRQLFVKIVLIIFTLLTTVFLIKYSLFRTTIPTIQLISLTKEGSFLTTSDAFINFILNFRLIELILFTTVSTIFFIDYLDTKRYIVVFLTKISFIAVVLFNQIFLKNPYPTIPSFRIRLGLDIYMFDLTSFIILTIFLSIDLTIFILTIRFVKNRDRFDYLIRKILLALISTLVFTILTLDYVVSYILLYALIYTIICINTVNRF
uniref:Uncharacterized protein n=1 Tax=Staphylothermus marinus TaxID=2280 RepID=A0A7C4D9Z1_STAMA